MKLCKDIENYVQNEIIPIYKNFDKAHNVSHINYVIDRSIDIADLYGKNINISYVAAAFHDIGIGMDREMHELIGAQIVNQDCVLRDYFVADEIRAISQAIREHRASYCGQYSSMYSKILAQSDRNFDINVMTKRAILYGRQYYSDMDDEQQYNRVYVYLREKYGKDGKVKMLLDYPVDEENVKWIYQCLDSQRRFREYYRRCWQAIEKGEGVSKP